MNNISQVYIFNDPYYQKDEIFKLTRNMPGCYIWLNRNNNKCYVGSSMNLAKRLYFYYGYKTVKILYTSLIISALLAHGMNNFTLILVIMPNNSEVKSILELEQFL